MSIYSFQASGAGTVGQTTAITTPASVTSTNTVLVLTSTLSSALLVTNTGTIPVFIRLSPEAAPVATAADIPLLAGSARVFSNPVPGGRLGVAVTPSAATACTVYITPGTGGI